MDRRGRENRCRRHRFSLGPWVDEIVGRLEGEKKGERTGGDVSRCQLPWSMSRPSCLSVKSGIEAGCKTIQKGIPPPRHLSPSCQTVGRPLFYRRSFLPCTYHSLERCLHRCLVHQSTAPRVIRGPGTTTGCHGLMCPFHQLSGQTRRERNPEGKVSIQICASFPFQGKKGKLFFFVPRLQKPRLFSPLLSLCQNNAKNPNPCRC